MLFQLYGPITWSGSRHENHTLAVDQEFEIPDGTEIEKAIEKAREIVKDLHERHFRLTDYTLDLGLRIITRKEIWETHFEPCRPGTPARSAQMETIGHFEEKRLI